ncbi:MAG: hypothetical protein HUU55_18655 [Myxococcales bacterium]|nr:hypothetical protein [Myxococcales bacterium]
MDARRWLRENDYSDIADMIDEIMDEWQSAGKKTRRNWWDILAGGMSGKPSTREGREFPVLRAAQQRQGKPITENALCRNPDEKVPPLVKSGRWPKK